MIPVGVAGKRIQNDDADSCNGKNRVSEKGQLRIAFLTAPVVLRQEANHYTESFLTDFYAVAAFTATIVTPYCAALSAGPFRWEGFPAAGMPQWG